MFCGNGGEKLLVLAEGLVKKHVASHSLHEPEGIHCFFHYKPLPILNSTLCCFILFTNVLKAQSEKNIKFTKRLEFASALMVYISILEQQAKYGTALDILSGKLGSLLLVEVDKLRIQVLSEAFIFNVKW